MIEIFKDLHDQSVNSRDYLFSEKLKWLLKIRISYLLIPVLLFFLEGANSFGRIIIFLIPFTTWVFLSKSLNKPSENSLAFQLYLDTFFFLFLSYLFVHQVRHLWLFIFIYSFLAASMLRAKHGIILYFFLNLVIYGLQKKYYYIFVNQGVIDPYLPYMLNTIVFLLSKSLTQQIDSTNEVLSGLRAKSLENDRLRALGSLMSGISHEFGTPINTLKIKLERYQKDEKRTLEKKEINTLINCVSNLERTLKKINNSNLDNYEDYLEEVNLYSFFEDLFKVWGEDKEAYSLTNSISENIILKINIINFTQMIFNLFDNSLESVGMSSMLKLEIFSKIVTEGIIITIKDNGEGVQESLRSRVGDPFFTTKEAGTGLGVYSSSLYLNSCGGDLFYEYKEQGVEANIKLPMDIIVKGANE